MDVAQYTAGVDRSPTEIAALFLADNPNADAVAFLVEGLGIEPGQAQEAVRLLGLGDVEPKARRSRRAETTD